MNTKHTIPSDEDLTAFIDGELTAEEAARIEALVSEDEHVAERLEFLARASLPFKQAFAPLLAEAPRQKLETMLAAIPAQQRAKSASALTFDSRRRFLGALAASLIAGIAIDRAVIGIGARLSAKDENSEWRSVVADYISLYTPETLAGPVPAREAQAAQLGPLDEKLGLSLSPEAVALPGIDFKRALLLQYDGKPLAQVAYLDPETGPMALCIVTSNAGPKAPDLESRKGMNVIYWSNATHAFMLIGRISADRMKELGEDVRRRLSA
ncbi:MULTISPECIES: anti-sigma factor family protein [Rhizobium]|jgi:anti-sigma factor RsiW|uniref:anti-sigma factor family protein n=1 Tax=Rhizobium TaxID=379 RepID=UPI000645CC60|nr:MULTISPECIES: transmembrane transcriptional regulator (anti-sigma factor) [Rhizobium]KZS49377.1 Fis family transcriptional regulator [Rhizobium anhuiense bv. trifolii]MBB3297543.1 anti-sigma factor RsiW [Rhizobium sp. BK112]MBB3367060.1 anti-sigma factor RsiW [Rhizobium sp. BK077]MBB4177962.1 anti-sigma factor RsiW [Rhizobium sp. BK109]NKM54617.1 anti-sigma factor [Rhizobium anhuiense]